MLAARYPAAHLTAVDISPRAVRKAQRRLGNRADIKLASAQQLPFEDAAFDTVFANLTFHHWNDKQVGLQEVARVLKPGGHFFMQDPLAEGFIAGRVLHRVAELLDGGTFIKKSGLEMMLNEVGLKPESIELIPNSWGTIFLTTVVYSLP